MRTTLRTEVEDLKRTRDAAAKTERDNQQKAHDHERLTARILRQDLQEFLMKELHHYKNFEVIAKDLDHVDQWGSIATVHEKNQFYGKNPDEERTNYVATVCVTSETGKWRGSDDSPEQYVTSTVIFMARIVNGDDNFIRMVLSDVPLKDWSYEKVVKKTVADFRKLMAAWLADERRR